MAGVAYPRVGGTLVGRERQLATVDRALTVLELGGDTPAQVLEVTGEPGIGKSRLLNAVRLRAAALGHLVLTGRAPEPELPFGVFADALDDHLATLEPRRLAARGVDLVRCGAVFPALAGAAGEARSPRPYGRYLTHRAVRQLFERLAATKPLVVVLDDLHWADSASVELLDHLLSHPPRGAILFAFGYRPRQAGVALAAALGRAAAEGTLESVRLEPLSFEQSARLLGPEVDEAARRRLYEVSGGNPFYLEALLQAGGGPALEPAGGDVGEVPSVVVSALLTEVSRVSAEARLVAQAAAVVGDPFDTELVAECAGLPIVDVLGCLDELSGHDLVRPTETPRRFQFRHPLVRHVVYQATSQVFRAAAHARTAKVLERRGAPASVRAHHVERSAEAGDAGAIGVLVEAAQESVTTAPVLAAHWLDVAGRLLPPGDVGTSEQRVELALARSRALAIGGDLVASRDLLHGVLAGMPAEPRAGRLRAVALCAMVERLLGRSLHARALVLRELEQHADHDTPDVAALHLELASSDLFRGYVPQTRERVSRARETARRHGDRALEARAAGLLAAGHVLAGDVAPALDWLDTATTLVDGLYDVELGGHLDALYWLGWSCAFLDRYEECLRHTDRTIRLVQATGQEYSFAYCYGARSAALQWLGRLDEAAAAADSAVEAAMLSASEEMRCFALGQRAWTAFLRGDLDAAVDAGERALRLGRAVDGATKTVRAYRHAIVRLTAGQGDADAVVEAAGGPEAPGLDDFNKAVFYEYLTAAEVARGRLTEADQWATRAERVAHPALPTRVGFALLARARVTLGQGAAEAAAAQALQAGESFARAADRFDAGRGHLLAGQASAQAGDRRGAARHAGRAADLFAACGAHAAHAEAIRDLRRHSGRAQPPAAESGPDLRLLTRREAEIAELVACGQSNREIAGQLFLSARTVETHVSHILAKLGVTTRVAIATALTTRTPPQP